MSDEHCEKCGYLLATPGPAGGLSVQGVPVLAIAAACPRCGHPFVLPRATGLEVGTEGLQKFVQSLQLIQSNEGYGTLVARFEKHRLVRVGLGELLFNVRY